MCVTCGCGRPKDDHGDERNLTKRDFRRAAKASDIDMHHLVANINNAYDDGQLGKGEAKPEDGVVAPYVQVEREQIENARTRTGDTDAVPRVKVFKEVAEQRYTLGVAYMPDHPDIGTALDGHRDQISAEELEKAAWRFMAKSPKVGLHHKDGTEKSGTVVESYIYRGPAWKIGGQTIKSGTWLVGVIWSPEAWAEIKAERVRGFSPQGTGKRTNLASDSTKNL